MRSTISRSADAGLLLAPLGLVAYCAFLWIKFRNPLAFLEVAGAPGWDQPPGFKTWFKVHWIKAMWNGPWTDGHFGHLLINALATVVTARPSAQSRSACTCRTPAARPPLERKIRSAWRSEWELATSDFGRVPTGRGLPSRSNTAPAESERVSYTIHLPSGDQTLAFVRICPCG